MNVNPINANSVSFEGYNSVLKTLYKQNLLPTVEKGFYGDVLTKENVSLEHLRPHSKGGPTVLWNLVLASKDKNSARGNEPFGKFFNKETATEYLNQFIGLVIPYKKGDRNKVFNGTDYAKSIQKTVKNLGYTIDLNI